MELSSLRCLRVGSDAFMMKVNLSEGHPGAAVTTQDSPGQILHRRYELHVESVTWRLKKAYAMNQQFHK